MTQDQLVRSDAPHTVQMRDGDGAAMSTRPDIHGGPRDESIRGDRRVVVDALAPRPPQAAKWGAGGDSGLADWGRVGSAPIKSTRVAHWGAPRTPSRVDFRPRLRSLREQNSAVRARLNALLGTPEQKNKEDQK